MTIEEKEQQLIQEINFFNHNMGWWESEFEKVNNELNQIEQKDPLGLKQKQREKLIARIKYLMAKANVEQKVSFEIDKKLYKLSLAKELNEIQGNFKNTKSKKNYQ